MPGAYFGPPRHRHPWSQSLPFTRPSLTPHLLLPYLFAQFISSSVVPRSLWATSQKFCMFYRSSFNALLYTLNQGL